MKYIIDIPDEKTYAYINDEKTFLRMPISLGENEIKSMFAPTMLRIKPYTEPDREAIENEVWDFVRSAFWNMTQEDIDQCYDGFFPDSYREAKTKYKVWKMRTDDIHVGDEVIFGERRGAVVGLEGDGVYIVWNDGKTVYMDRTDILKTGEFFGWVGEFMEKIRGLKN